MLIKATGKCGRGCSHCMENSTPADPHMSEETFLKALVLTARLERTAWQYNCPKNILLSGGECTEHPNIVRFIEIVQEFGFNPVLISNGMFLADEVLREAILRKEWPNLFVQVTYDPRFYPEPAPPVVDDPRICYIDSLSGMIQLGRFKGDGKGVAMLQAPKSFNLRSLTRSYKSVEVAIAYLRLNAVRGKSGNCTPNIAEDGTVHAGESRLCWQIGTVDSTTEEITDNLLKMGECNRCRLEDNLNLQQRRAIGLTTLYGPAE